MRKFIAALLVLCLGSVSSWAEDATGDRVAINQDVPDRYVVVKGDTLWDIAKMFLEDPWKWQDIWYINPQIENPHLIYPGDVIGLIMVDGERRLTTLSRGAESRTLRVSPDDAEGGVVKLRPTARITPIFGAIPAIPREHVEGFLSGNRVVAEDTLITAPYIVSGLEGRLLMGAGDTVYGRGDFDEDLRVYQIYRQGEELIDPETRESLGFEAIELGQARLETTARDIGTMTLQRSNQQIMLEDRLLPSDEALLSAVFYPSEPPEGVEGEILRVARGVKSIGQFDVVIVNRGEREGVEPGNIFRVFQQGGRVTDPVTGDRLQLPGQDAGLMMIFRVFDRVSYGLILEADMPMSVGDTVSSPGF
ncbi:LysM peptidoglycan-binding domain-containing protein [Saccharospirillum salsuginis]|uniref:LysM domain-containing protein n=1 Tax=Saccharospirillum salsuginis TaxID=418750 RepID=A0A918N8S0_9GAMM|nr:LysM peptidoglycan-binding domain-containing protein [Saccharospirillum salsuginis]GGX49319.1 hypothetical protein GCM10007392_15770 [Saccharospirillum salsuginis]